MKFAHISFIVISLCTAARCRPQTDYYHPEPSIQIERQELVEARDLDSTEEILKKIAEVNESYKKKGFYIGGDKEQERIILEKIAEVNGKQMGLLKGKELEGGGSSVEVHDDVQFIQVENEGNFVRLKNIRKANDLQKFDQNRADGLRGEDGTAEGNQERSSGIFKARNVANIQIYDASEGDNTANIGEVKNDLHKFDQTRTDGLSGELGNGEGLFDGNQEGILDENANVQVYSSSEDENAASVKNYLLNFDQTRADALSGDEGNGEDLLDGKLGDVKAGEVARVQVYSSSEDGNTAIIKNDLQKFDQTRTDALDNREGLFGGNQERNGGGLAKMQDYSANEAKNAASVGVVKGRKWRGDFRGLKNRNGNERTLQQELEHVDAAREKHRLRDFDEEINRNLRKILDLTNGNIVNQMGVQRAAVSNLPRYGIHGNVVGVLPEFITRDGNGNQLWGDSRMILDGDGYGLSAENGEGSNHADALHREILAKIAEESQKQMEKTQADNYFKDGFMYDIAPEDDIPEQMMKGAIAPPLNLPLNPYVYYQPIPVIYNVINMLEYPSGKDLPRTPKLLTGDKAKTQTKLFGANAWFQNQTATVTDETENADVEKGIFRPSPMRQISKDNVGSGIFIHKLKVKKGGVAIAGPGGIATAGSGGTAIVGPNGYAFTHPDSLAIAGSGTKVVAVDPSINLRDLISNNYNRTRTNGSSPRVGKIVATGPVIYYNKGDTFQLLVNQDGVIDNYVSHAKKQFWERKLGALAPYKAHPLFEQVKRGGYHGGGWVFNIRNPSGQDTTTLILKPMAKAVAGQEGRAIATPQSRAVLRRGMNVDILFEPDAVAVAGPGGIAHAESDLEIVYDDQL